MNICLIINDYSCSGGAERVADNLINAWKDEHKIMLISTFNMKGKPCREIPKEVSYYVACDFAQRKMSKPELVKRTLSIASQIRKFKTDIVIGMGMGSALTSVLAGKIARAGVIVCDHSSIYNENFGKLIVDARKKAVKFADKIVVLTEDCRKGYIEESPGYEDKILTIGNWIEPAAFVSSRYNSSAKRIMTVSRPDTVKGVELLLETAKTVKKKLPDWSWDVWGDFSVEPEYTKRLMELSSELGVDDFVTFKGHSSEIYSLYQNYSIYVMTSRNEGLPMVLLEAQANKLPTVSFDCKTGPAEIINDGKNGYIIPCFDVELMAEKIVELACDEVKRCEFSDNAGMWLDKFSKTEILKQWNELFLSMKKGKG